MPNFKIKSVPLNANNLTAGVKSYIKLNGGWAVRINTMGVYDAERGIFRPVPEEDKGVSDVIGTYRGYSLFVEIKIGTDKQSEEQENFQRNMETAGGWYFIARNMNDFITNFNNKKYEIDSIRGFL